MAKTSKDTTASATKKETKVKATADPVTTKNLVRLLNILALLLAIAAFLLQFFAVISHHWKSQATNLQPLLTSGDRPLYTNIAEDSRIDQRYGLFSRDVKVYANNDQQLNVWTGTHFPRLDNNNYDDLNQCLLQTSTLSGAFLTCARRVKSIEQCHCRRYPYWNAIIFFEIAALVLLGIALVATALLTTQFHGLLKLIGVALSFLAFIFLLIGLILLLSYLKRETRSLADTYPYIHSRLANKVSQNQHYPTVLHKAIRRQAHETYRNYQLAFNQRPFNDTHFLQISEKGDAWIPIPYSSWKPIEYAPREQSATTQSPTTEHPYNPYGPELGYAQVYESTKACIGWSAVLSIIALILSLLLALIFAFSWLTAKKLGPEVTTVTQTTVTTTQYQPVPQEVTGETVPLTQPVIVESTVRDEQLTTTTSRS